MDQVAMPQCLGARRGPRMRSESQYVLGSHFKLSSDIGLEAVHARIHEARFNSEKYQWRARGF